MVKINNIPTLGLWHHQMKGLNFKQVKVYGEAHRWRKRSL